MCNIFNPDCWLDHSLTTNGHRPNDMRSGKLHKKIFHLLAEATIKFHNALLLHNAAQNSSWWTDKFFFCVTKEFTILRRLKNQFKTIWRYLMSWQIMFQAEVCLYRYLGREWRKLLRMSAAKPRCHILIFFSSPKNWHLCCLVVMGHFASARKASRDYKTDKPSSFRRHFSANHNQPHLKVRQKQEKSIHLCRFPVDWCS